MYIPRSARTFIEHYQHIARLGLLLGLLLPALGLAAASATPVAVAPITRVSLAQQLELVGTAIPERLSRISAQVDGQVSRIQVEEGDQVAAGALLFTLDEELADIALQRRRAELNQAQANEKDAARQLAESQRLREQGHIPNSTLEASVTAMAVAEALVKQRQADLAEAEALRERHEVKAPFAGSVVRKLTEVGQWLTRGTAALELAQTDPLRIVVAVPQRLVGTVMPGSSAQVRFDALSDSPRTLTVNAVIPRGDDNSRTTPVWLALPNPDGQVLPGMSARVLFADASRQDLVLAVPNDALVRRVDGSSVVWVVREQESSMTVRPMAVQVGRSDARFTEVLNPVAQAGDRVVVRGNESLRPNQSVRIVDYPVADR